MIHRKIALLIAVFMLLSFAASPALSVPAAPIVHTLEQQDGSKFMAKLWGDEWNNGFETLEGYTIIFNETSKNWVYAGISKDGELVMSNKVVVNDVPSGIQKHLRGAKADIPAETSKIPSISPPISSIPPPPQFATTPSSGTVNLPVIAIRYTNQNNIYATTDFEKLLFNSTAGSKSMRDYYREISYGNLTLTSGSMGVRGWYVSNNTHNYYGYNQGFQRAALLVKEAVQKADAAGFDFSSYDNNHDGYVDGVVIIHSGNGAEASGDKTDIWSHRWSLSSAGVGTYTTRSGLIVNDYIIQPEILWGNIQTMGVFAHEFGHLMGLPDLYDTTYSSEGIGTWSLMAGGSWNGISRSGDTPAQLDAWSKSFLGWVSPLQITYNTFKQIKQVEYNSEVYQLLDNPNGVSDWSNGNGKGEYFLIENRRKVGFDAALPGEGLLIWHIDESIEDNTNKNHKLVDLEEADGRNDLDSRNNSGDAFDPWYNSTVGFTENTIPNSKLYNGSTSGVRVTNISASAAIMTANLTVGGATPASSCITISSQGTYVLNQSIINSSASTCISITSSNVIFDGAGFTIDGQDTLNTYGLYVYNSTTTLTNVTVKNLKVTDWNYGIYYRNTTNGNISNNNVSSNNGSGISISAEVPQTAVAAQKIAGVTPTPETYTSLFSGRSAESVNQDILSISTSSIAYDQNINSNNVISNNTILNNSGYGMLLRFSSNSTLKGNTVLNNDKDGIQLQDYSSNNVLYGNTVISNNWSGIVIRYSYSENNTVDNNNASLNKNAGIFVFVVNNNTVTNNTVIANGHEGIASEYTSNNIIKNNTVKSNGWWNIIVYASQNTTVSDNTANSNNYDGINLGYSNNNIVINNNASSKNTNGIYLYSSSNNTLRDNTANSNSNTGINLIGSSNNNTLTNNNVISNNWDGIYLYLSTNNTLTNNNASLNNWAGIDIDNSNSNNLIKNNASSNFYSGIRLHYSNSSALTNNTASNNTDGFSLDSSSNNTLTSNNASLNNKGIWSKGIDLWASSNNTLSGNTANFNSYSGIRLDASGSNNLINNLASWNGFGIVLASSSNNSLTSNTANSNVAGIYFDASSNNNLTGNTANSNDHQGISLLSSSNNNTLTNNAANSNGWDGINHRFSSNNRIYNNRFNNTNNFDIEGTNSSYWNTTKIPGTNIVGGPYLGGNFWANQGSTGFSQTCADSNGDGICDSAYYLDGSNIDYLPLAYKFASTPTANLSIASQTVSSNGTVTVPIMANNITNVAAYTISLTYNPAVVVVNSVTAGALGGVFATINNATGVTLMSAFTTTPQSGNVVLANVVLRATGTAGQTSPLTLTVTTLSDNNGNTIPATVSSGTFNISPIKKGDVTGDGKVDITDALFIAQYTVGLRTLTPTQLAAGDVNCDGKVDITDALFIAQNTVGLRTTFC